MVESLRTISCSSGGFVVIVSIAHATSSALFDGVGKDPQGRRIGRWNVLIAKHTDHYILAQGEYGQGSPVGEWTFYYATDAMDRLFTHAILALIRFSVDSGPVLTVFDVELGVVKLSSLLLGTIPGRKIVPGISVKPNYPEWIRECGVSRLVPVSGGADLLRVLTTPIMPCYQVVS